MILSLSFYSQGTEFMSYQKPRGMTALVWIKQLESRRETRSQTTAIDREIAQTLVGKYGIRKKLATSEEREVILKIMWGLVQRNKSGETASLYTTRKVFGKSNPHVQTVLILNALITDRLKGISSTGNITIRHPELKSCDDYRIEAVKRQLVFKSPKKPSRVFDEEQSTVSLKDRELFEKLEPLNWTYEVVRPLPKKPMVKSPHERHIDFLVENWEKIRFSYGQSILNDILGKFDWCKKQEADNPKAPFQPGDHPNAMGFHKFSFPKFDLDDQSQLPTGNPNAYRTITQARMAINNVVDDINLNVLKVISSEGQVSSISDGYLTLAYALVKTLLYLRENPSDDIWRDLFQRLAATGEHCEYGKESAAAILHRISGGNTREDLENSTLQDYVARKLLRLRDSIFYEKVASFVFDKEHMATHNNYGHIVVDNPQNFGFEISPPVDQTYRFGGVGKAIVGYQLKHDIDKPYSEKSYKDLGNLTRDAVVKRFFFGKRPGPNDPFYNEAHIYEYGTKRLRPDLSVEEQMEYRKSYEGYTPRSIVFAIMKDVNAGGGKPKDRTETQEESEKRLDDSKRAKSLANLVHTYLDQSLSVEDVDRWLKGLQEGSEEARKLKDTFGAETLEDAREYCFSQRNNTSAYKKLFYDLRKLYVLKQFPGGSSEIPTENAIILALEKLGYIEKMSPESSRRNEVQYRKERIEDEEAKKIFIRQERETKEVTPLKVKKKLTELEMRQALLRHQVIETLHQVMPINVTVGQAYQYLIESGLEWE